MTAWDELQQWLMLHVGSKEADECSEIVKRIITDAFASVEIRVEGGGGEGEPR
jgi:hypothetical protein